MEAARAAGAKEPIAAVVSSTDLGEDSVRLALAYHARYPEDVDRRIEAADELAAALGAVGE